MLLKEAISGVADEAICSLKAVSVLAASVSAMSAGLIWFGSLPCALIVDKAERIKSLPKNNTTSTSSRPIMIPNIFLNGGRLEIITGVFTRP